MKPGDLVMRTKTSVYKNMLGVILKLHMRDPEKFPEVYCVNDPVHRITVLQENGYIRTWYAVHAEVISEAR